MLTINAPTWIEFLIGQSAKIIANESKVHHKCGRPISSKGKNPIKKKSIWYNHLSEYLLK
jgi:hypothetical protein